MPVRTSPPVPDEARLRAETAARRAAFQAKLERDRRLLAGFAGLATVIGAAAMLAVARVFGA